MSKYGFQKGIQHYKCGACKRIFISKKVVDSDQLWHDYPQGKQTYQQLAIQNNCSIKTIQRKLDLAQTTVQTNFPSVVNVLMDTTYFGRIFGVMVFKDSLTSQILYKQYVQQETNIGYKLGIEKIAQRGIIIQAIICDGRKGLLKLFAGIPIQMCNFHQESYCSKIFN